MAGLFVRRWSAIDYVEAVLLDPDDRETRLKVERIRATNRTGTKPSSLETSGKRARLTSLASRWLSHVLCQTPHPATSKIMSARDLSPAPLGPYRAQKRPGGYPALLATNCGVQAHLRACGSTMTPPDGGGAAVQSGRLFLDSGSRPEVRKNQAVLISLFRR